MHRSNRWLWLRCSVALAGLVALAAGVMAFTDSAQAPATVQVDQEIDPMVLQGRELVISHACGGCHGGVDDPTADGWLTGVTSPAQEFQMGPCLFNPDDPCFTTRPRNLTPHNTTGLGRFSERQIFNALRFGLRPGETADVEITSTTPGEGNFPMFPKYLAPPMPWNSWRHMSDDELRAIAAYLKRGLKPVENQVEDSEGPPDFWASSYTAEVYGVHPAPPFPAAAERMPTDPSVDVDQVVRGRQVVLESACGDCHGGFSNPAAEGYLAGVTAPVMEFDLCLAPDAPCLKQRPRNLTPDMETGTGAFTERQIFNLLRYGLRPSSTGDVEIQGGHLPDGADRVSLGMPWVEFRHKPDSDLWAVAAYLKHGVKPVANTVQDTDAPPGGWGPVYAQFLTSSHPAPAFPTKNETGG